eukprot:403336119
MSQQQSSQQQHQQQNPPSKNEILAHGVSQTKLQKNDTNNSEIGDSSNYNANATTSSVEDFKLLGRLGDGAYSQVYKVKRIHDGSVYALKKVRLNHLSEKEKENAINEVRILASINHVNVISYKEAFIEPNTQSLCIVMEYADNGDLFQKIADHQQDGTFFQEHEIWKIFIQVVRGLRAMHDLNVMHRDLKSANVFLNKDLTVKLGDMNVSKVANQKGLNYTQTGTPYYASPEVWKDEPYDIKSDIWSLGCVLHEIIALKPPFQANDMNGLYKKIVRGQIPKLPKHYSTDLQNIVRTLLQVNPTQRPTCLQLTQIPSFQKRFTELFPELADQEKQDIKNELLKTIRIPKNIMYLSNRLPMANYGNTLKRSNVFKTMNRSLNHNNNRNHYQSINGMPSIKNVNVHESQINIKLPNLEVQKSLVNKRSSYDESNIHGLTKNASKIKIVSRNDFDVLSQAADYQEKRSIQSLDRNSNSGSKRNNSLSPNQFETKHIKQNQLSGNKNSMVIEDGLYNNKEIIAQSSVNLNAHNDSPYNEKQKYTTDETSQNSYAIKDLSQQHSLITQNRNLQLIQRDKSLKRLQRDKSSESGIFLNHKQERNFKGQQTDNYKVSQDKLQDIYSIKQFSKGSIKTINPQNSDKRQSRHHDINIRHSGLPSHILVNSQKLNIMPYQSATIDSKDDDLSLQRIQIKEQIKQSNNSVKSALFHNGLPINHKQKKSSNYVDSIARIANVYAKQSQSPIQSRKMKEQISNSLVQSQLNNSVNYGNYLNERHHSVSISMSSVKLPHLHNRSIAHNESIDLSNVEVYNPYENRNQQNTLKQQPNLYSSSNNTNQASTKLLKRSLNQINNSQSIGKLNQQQHQPYNNSNINQQYIHNIKKQRQYLLMNQKQSIQSSISSNMNLETSFKSNSNDRGVAVNSGQQNLNFQSTVNLSENMQQLTNSDSMAGLNQSNNEQIENKGLIIAESQAL